MVFDDNVTVNMISYAVDTLNNYACVEYGETNPDKQVAVIDYYKKHFYEMLLNFGWAYFPSKNIFKKMKKVNSETGEIILDDESIVDANDGLTTMLNKNTCKKHFHPKLLFDLERALQKKNLTYDCMFAQMVIYKVVFGHSLLNSMLYLRINSDLPINDICNDPIKCAELTLCSTFWWNAVVNGDPLNIKSSTALSVGIKPNILIHSAGDDNIHVRIFNCTIHPFTESFIQ